MLVRIFTIIALLVFIILLILDSTIEPAIFKSLTVFGVLVIGTRISSHLLKIITENTHSEKSSSPSHN